MEVDYINGPRTDKIFGMSKYQMEIFKRIKGIKWNIIEYDSLTQLIEKRYKADLNSTPQSVGNASQSKNKTIDFVVDIAQKP